MRREEKKVYESDAIPRKLGISMIDDCEGTREENTGRGTYADDDRLISRWDEVLPAFYRPLHGE